MNKITIRNTNFEFANLKNKYEGKVRDVYYFEDQIMMVTSDRISAFDTILPAPIPYKGAILNSIAFHNLELTRDIVPNWAMAMPHPNIMIGKICTTYPVEMVVRGYLAGHAWRLYREGVREVCGVELPEGLQQNDRLPQPIITPTTKALEGKDEDISRQQIIERGLVSKEQYQQLEQYALALYQRGTEIAAERGLILVDTKYEFGYIGDTIYLIDEIHTPDSSRYFYQSNYEEYQAQSIPQKQLSKEFVREWLIQNDFQGKEGQSVPEMTPAVISSISERYQELYSILMGHAFATEDYTPLTQKIVQDAVDQLIG